MAKKAQKKSTVEKPMTTLETVVDVVSGVFKTENKDSDSESVELKDEKEPESKDEKKIELPKGLRKFDKFKGNK